ncbi:MAG: CoxG family protein [Candidatus Acidiferrales bacterium]
MAIAFAGEFQVHRPAADVFVFLTDPEQFAPLLPDFQGLSVEDEKNFTVNVKVGISHIGGTASLKLRLAATEPPRKALYEGKGSVAGGSVDLNAGFELEEDSAGWTRVRWKGEAHLFGPLLSVAGGLLEPLAKKNVQKLISGLQKALL